MHKVVAISSDANWSRRTPDRGLGWLSMEWRSDQDRPPAALDDIRER
jgi:hypothetical protein